MKKWILVIVVLLSVLVTLGSVQAATISGTIERNFGGECQSYPTVTFTSDDASSEITRVIIDITGLGSTGLAFFDEMGPCGAAGGPMTDAISGFDTPQLTVDFTGFAPGETWVRNIDDDDNPTTGGTPVTWAGGTVTVTIDGSCTLQGTFVDDGSFQAHAEFGGTCGNGVDLCPDDPAKTEPGVCGCGTPDTDRDGDGIADCIDNCPDDPTNACGTPIPEFPSFALPLITCAGLLLTVTAVRRMR